MEKKGVLVVVFFFLLGISIVWFTSLISGNEMISGNAVSDLLQNTLAPIGNLNIGQDFYNKEKYGYLIDWILVLIIFVALSKQTLSKTLDNRGATALGVLLSFAFAFAESQFKFFMGDLGPIILLIVLLILPVIVYMAFKRSGHGFLSFALSYLIAYWILSAVLTKNNGNVLLFGSDSLFSSLWAWMQLLAYILLIIIIIKMFGKMFSFFRQDQDARDALDATKGIGKGLWGGAKGIGKFGKGAIDEFKDWNEGREVQKKLVEIENQNQKLDALTQSIEQQNYLLDKSNIQNEQDRVKLLAQIENLIQSMNSIRINFKNKNPNVNAGIAQNTQELKEKYASAKNSLVELVKKFYGLLIQETDRIKQQIALSSQDMNYLDNELNTELKSQERYFKNLWNKVFHMNKDQNANLQKDFKIVQDMRSNIAMILMEIRKNVQNLRNSHKSLGSLNNEDLSLANEFNANLKGQNLDINKSIEQIKKLRMNLGKEMAINNYASLKNQKILELRAKIAEYHKQLILLNQAISQEIEKIMSNVQNNPQNPALELGSSEQVLRRESRITGAEDLQNIEKELAIKNKLKKRR